jgi:hypothetical protein
MAKRIEPRRYLREVLAKVLSGEKNLAALLPEAFARTVGRDDSSNVQAAPSSATV